MSCSVVVCSGGQAPVIRCPFSSARTERSCIAYISPTGQRFPRPWDVDVPPGALSAALEALTIACQLVRVFDCGRAPYKGDGGNQPNQQGARISHRQLAPSRIRVRYFDPRATFRSRETTSRVSSLSLVAGPVQVPEMLGRAWNLVPLSAFAFHRWLVAHHGHDTDGSKSGKSKGACTGLGQINAAAFNIRASVRDRDRDGMTILLVGDPDFGTEGQRFVRRRHGVIVERDATGSFSSRLRRVTHGVHRCDTVFGTNWNVEQTK